ncbi:MAG TPA: hypothetical protein V6C86_16015 [Oculatellaceae cyanobacterium]
MTRISRSLTRIAAVLFCLCLQLLSTHFCQTTHAHANSTADADCMIVEQQHDEIGQVRTIIAKDAIRIDLLWSKAYLIAKAPTWRVVLYNPANKLAMDMPLETYLSESPNWQGANRYRELDRGKLKVETPTKKLGKIKYADRDCLKFGVVKIVGNKVDPRDRYKAYYYTFPDSSVRPEISQILYHFFLIQTSSNQGIPVYSASVHDVKAASLQHDIGFLANLTSGDLSSHMTTSKFSSASFPSSYFEYPKNYKKVSYELDVLSDANRKGVAEDMLHDLRFGEESSNSAKKFR